MKQISLFGFLILLLAAAVFFLRDKGARAELQDAHQQIASLSNEVATARTIVAMHSVTNSELRQQIATILERVVALSNAVAKASEEAKRGHQEYLALQSELQKQTRKAVDAELRKTDLESELSASRKMVEGRGAEIARLTERLETAEAEQMALHGRLQKADADLVRMQLDMTDEAVLRAQLKRLKRQWLPVGFARTPNIRVEDKGSKDLTAKVDSHAKGYYLQIQPDGTVKVVPPLEAAGGAR